VADLKRKYPYVESQRIPSRDRVQSQYWRLISGEDMKVTEFVLKWEYVHEKRIHKNMAWELLTEMNKKRKVSDEWLEKVYGKYENYD
jgi:hypothetical protein